MAYGYSVKCNHTLYDCLERNNGLESSWKISIQKREYSIFFKKGKVQKYTLNQHLVLLFLKKICICIVDKVFKALTHHQDHQDSVESSGTKDNTLSLEKRDILSVHVPIILVITFLLKRI